jgi:hypothetical protein
MEPGTENLHYLLTYFSHSYRPAEKEINLFFWELLTRLWPFFSKPEARENSWQIRP